MPQFSEPIIVISVMWLTEHVSPHVPASRIAHGGTRTKPVGSGSSSRRVAADSVIFAALKLRVVASLHVGVLSQPVPSVSEYCASDFSSRGAPAR